MATLADIPIGGCFRAQNGRLYQRLDRATVGDEVVCEEMETGRTTLFMMGLAGRLKVEPVDDPELRGNRQLHADATEPAKVPGGLRVRTKKGVITMDVKPVCIVCNCDHLPPFDRDAARGMTSQEVRKRWPRYDGECGKCGAKFGGISYASMEHYILGDW